MEEILLAINNPPPPAILKVIDDPVFPKSCRDALAHAIILNWGAGKSLPFDNQTLGSSFQTWEFRSVPLSRLSLAHAEPGGARYLTKMCELLARSEHRCLGWMETGRGLAEPHPDGDMGRWENQPELSAAPGRKGLLVRKFHM